jgi:hypothetical protein
VRRGLTPQRGARVSNQKDANQGPLGVLVAKDIEDVLKKLTFKQGKQWPPPPPEIPNDYDS